MKIVSLRLPDELHEALKRLAKQDNRSLHNLIVTVLWNFVRESEKAEKPQG